MPGRLRLIYGRGRSIFSRCLFLNPARQISRKNVLSEIAVKHFAVDGEATQLVSERDQNTRISAPDGRTFVLKVANANEQIELLELQNAALAHIGLVSEGLDVPRVVQSVNNQSIEWLDGPDGQRHATRLLTFLPGHLFSGAQKTLPLAAQPGQRCRQTQ